MKNNDYFTSMERRTNSGCCERETNREKHMLGALNVLIILLGAILGGGLVFAFEVLSSHGQDQTLQKQLGTIHSGFYLAQSASLEQGLSRAALLVPTDLQKGPLTCWIINGSSTRPEGGQRYASSHIPRGERNGKARPLTWCGMTKSLRRTFMKRVWRA
jgi:hypothetical protein